MGFFKKLFGKKTDDLYAPIAGKAVPVTQVPDPTFAEGLLGNGIAIEPTDGKVYAPCDATVDMMFTTGHAVSLVADCGAEILIHIGLETVSLEGKPFTVHVANGDKVKKGQLMIEVDLEAIKALGLPTITPMLICNTDDYPTFNTFVDKDVTNETLSSLWQSKSAGKSKVRSRSGDRPGAAALLQRVRIGGPLQLSNRRFRHLNSI